MKPLTPRQIDALPVGTHRIASRLYLKREDRPSGSSRTVIFRWQQDGKGRVLSLGAWGADNYAHFLARAAGYRKALAAGQDPSVERDRASAPTTFKAAAEEFYDQANFASAKHLQHCRDSMATVGKVLGNLKIADIQTEHVARSLTGMWLATPITGQRVRRRIAEVLDFALARNGIEKFNPASWDRLKHILPRQPKHRVQNYKSLPYRNIPKFVETLPRNDVMTAAAMRFLILTCTRTKEAVHARWSEIDFDSATWTISADRMKAGREHRVALSDPAIAILRPLYENRISEYVFPGRHDGEPLTPNALGIRLRDMGHRGTFTVHGFRSGFKDWSRETTQYSWELVELALAHQVGNSTERAYGRSDLLHLRRPLMKSWGEFVTGTAALEIVLSKAA